MSSCACCILAVSSSVPQAKGLVERVISVSGSTDTTSFSKETALELPWTISNKYYTAPVHFSIIETPNVKGEDAAEVPACVFVFSVTEPFKDEFSSMIARLGDSDFEVSIAVSVPDTQTGQPSEDVEPELESFFNEHGFEYVNGHSDRDLVREHDIDDIEGVPGIGRLIDALSTIIWPSMVQKEGSRRAKARSIVSVPGPPEEEDGLRSLLNVDASGDTSIQHEMDALEKWLEEGAEDDKDPWEGRSFSSRPAQDAKAEVSRPAASGFDDDFSDFVSATTQSSGGAADTDEDSALPSRAEIEATYRNIFSVAAADEMGEDDSHGSFDLSRIMGALEVMKEEIASITDEDEKRKAAAKVALGLVYGLTEG